MWIALTGTPGTGKSSVAAALGKRGIKTKTVLAIAREAGALGKKDEHMDSLEIDVDRCKEFIKGKKNNFSLAEGHLSHLLGLPWAVILRCRPSALLHRLEGREYSKEKIRSNVESEALDVILVEALERYDKINVFEVDTSIKGVGDVASEVAAIMEIINGHEKGGLSAGELASFKVEKDWIPGNLDWSGDFMTVTEEIQ